MYYGYYMLPDGTYCLAPPPPGVDVNAYYSSLPAGILPTSSGVVAPPPPGTTPPPPPAAVEVSSRTVSTQAATVPTRCVTQLVKIVVANKITFIHCMCLCADLKETHGVCLYIYIYNYFSFNYIIFCFSVPKPQLLPLFPRLQTPSLSLTSSLSMLQGMG